MLGADERYRIKKALSRNGMGCFKSRCGKLEAYYEPNYCPDPLCEKIIVKALKDGYRSWSPYTCPCSKIGSAAAIAVAIGMLHGR